MEYYWISVTKPDGERHIFATQDSVLLSKSEEFLAGWDAEANGVIDLDRAGAEVHGKYVALAVQEIGGPNNWYSQEGWQAMLLTTPVHPTTLASSILHWEQEMPELVL